MLSNLFEASFCNKKEKKKERKKNESKTEKYFQKKIITIMRK